MSSEPGQGTRHFEQDLVALGLLPDDAPSGMLPVKVKGDGSCLFHAVSLAVAALDGDHQDPASLRTKCADELAANAASYARVLEEKAEQCAKLSSDFSKKSLVLSCLSDEAAKVLERRPAVENLSTALEKALLTESETARLRNSWTSLPHLAALATCLNRRVTLVYPDVNKLLRPLYNGNFQPLGPSEGAMPSIFVMFSSYGPLTTTEGMVGLNHFVPLVPEHLTTKAVASSASQTAIKSKKAQGTITSFFTVTPALKRKTPEVRAPEPAAKKPQPGHHRLSGFDEKWRDTYPWVETVLEQNKPEEGNKFPLPSVIGMLCRLCRKHSRRPAKVSHLVLLPQCL